jgi:GAF domain-containing protein
MREARTVQIDDLSKTQLYLDGDQTTVRIADEEGLLSRMSVPLLKDGMALSSIMLSRIQPTGFSESEVLLIETFAAQAVIAIENVRQFREMQERLEREKALAEILDAISRSRDDEAPVFDIILKSAARLCGAPVAGLVLLNELGDTLMVKGVWGDVDSRLELPSNGFAVDSDVFPARAFRAAETLHC